MATPARADLRLAALLGTLLLGAGHALANPCSDKHWVSGPVLARGDGEGRGIGGTGHGDQGIGGTGRGGDDQGIGGTGHESDGRGIGGTGIVGVVAGFGSICVNGQEIHYGPRTPVRLDGLPAPAASLALGQMVSVRAESLGGGEFRAAEIGILHAVTGPAERPTPSRLRILGQEVVLPADALATIAPGEVLAVSGSRQPDGRILATRAVRLSQLAQATLSGPATGIGDGRFQIGSQEVQQGRLPAPAEGEEVLVRGRLENGVLLAGELVRQPAISFSTPVRQLLIQGYVRHNDGRTLDVDGVQVTAGVLAAGAGLSGGRVEITARVEADGRIVAERLSLERPAPADQRAAPATDTRMDGKTGSRAGSADGTRPASADGADPRPLAGGAPRPDLPRTDMQRPDITRPDIARPDLPRPDLSRPDLQRPYSLRPEMQRPPMPGR